MKKIPVSGGKFHALVDDLDFDLVSEYTWVFNQSKHATGYARTWLKLGRSSKKQGVRRKRLSIGMHQLIFKCMGHSAEMEPDHYDGNGLNNQRSNLRPATRAQQCQNRSPVRGKKNKGIGFWKGRWRARIAKGERRIFLGYFQTEEEAVRAYNVAATELFGEYARLNAEAVK